MAIVKMNRLTLMGLESERDHIMDLLMKMGVVEINDLELKEEALDICRIVGSGTGLDTEIAEVASALETLDKYTPEKKGLFSAKKEVPRDKFEDIINNQKAVWDEVSKIRAYQESILSFYAEENRLNNLIASLKPWESLEVKLDKDATRKTVTAFGAVPSALDIDSFMQEYESKVPFGYINHISSDKDQHYVFTIAHQEYEHESVNILKSYGWSKVVFRDLAGTPKQNIEILNKKIQDIKQQRDISVEDASKLAEKRDELEVLFDYLTMQRELKNTLDKVAATNRAFMLEGWIPANIKEHFQKVLEEDFHCMVNIVEPDKDEEFPVLLANNKFAESAEPVTQMYSFPNSKEIDPNAIMAPFFVLFFGLMLSDGGYGLIMAALCGFALYKFNFNDSMKKFVRLFFFCGLSTMFWGLLFGGWFGDLIPRFIMGDPNISLALWFDPVAKAETLLAYSLLFGVIHIFIGFGVKAANLIRRKQYLDVIFDVVFWYIFFIGFIFIVLPFVPTIPVEKVGGLVVLGKKLLAVGAVLLVLSQGRNAKNFFGKVLGGVSSLYDLVSFMSDVLSYSRLLALGLATSVIATIVNQMASMLGFQKWWQIIAFVLIFIFGHIFNFAINALGTYVHASRLQYVEFYGKFYKGEGKPFNPLKINTKYITIK